MIYRLTGVDETHEMHWTEYTIAMLLFSVVSMILLYLILRAQQWLPLNPQKFGGLAPDLAFNTAASFTTNTNWQAYSGETTMSYFTQMAGLAYHNFASAATGIAIAIAFDSWHRAAGKGNHRQLLGRFHTVVPLGAAPGLPGRRSLFRLAGRNSEFQAV